MDIRWFVLFGACVAVVAVFFWMRRNSLPKISIEHEHKMNSETAQIAKQAVGAVSGVATKGLDAVNSVAGSARDIAQPLTAGVGDLLKAWAESVRGKQQAREELMAEREALREEIQQLKARQVNVTQVEQQLKIALVRVSNEYSSWKNTEFNQESGGWGGLERATCLQYLGLLHAKFEVNLGVDLEKLTFSIENDSTVRVHGTRQVEIIGFQNVAVDRKFTELRRVYKQSGRRSGEIEVLPDNTELVKHYSDQNATVLAEIQNSQALAHLAEANARLARGFLQTCLGASRYQFAESSEPLPLSFFQLCEQINGLIAERLSALQERENDCLTRARVLDSEIVLLAAGARQVLLPG